MSKITTSQKFLQNIDKDRIPESQVLVSQSKIKVLEPSCLNFDNLEPSYLNFDDLIAGIPSNEPPHIFPESWKSYKTIYSGIIDDIIKSNYSIDNVVNNNLNKSRSHNFKFIKNLLESPKLKTDPAFNDYSALKNSICMNWPEITKLLVEYIKDGTTIVLPLINQYARVGDFGYTQKDIKDLKLHFLNLKYNSNQSDKWTNIQMALEYKDFDLANQILDDPNYDPSESDNAAIICATGRCNYAPIEFINRLLRDPRVNSSALDNVPLSNTFIHKRYDVAKLLIKFIKDGYSIALVNLLHYYEDKNSEEFNKLFMYFATNPECDITYKNNSVLESASESNHIKLLQILLKDPRITTISKDFRGLLLAAQNGHYEVVKLLLEDGRFDPLGYNCRGKYALDMARQNKHTKIIKLLEDYLFIKKSKL